MSELSGPSITLAVLVQGYRKETLIVGQVGTGDRTFSGHLRDRQRH
jgi:hypothetical protein